MIKHGIIIQTIADKGAGFKVLDNPALDTTSAYGQLLLNIIEAIAQFERALILARTGEGRTRAMARGVRFGRKPKLTSFQISEAIRRRDAGEAMTDIGRSYGVSHSTISRLRPFHVHLVAAGQGATMTDNITALRPKPKDATGAQRQARLTQETQDRSNGPDQCATGTDRPTNPSPACGEGHGHPGARAAVRVATITPPEPLRGTIRSMAVARLQGVRADASCRQS